MALLHQHSCECVKSELEIFSVPETQHQILGYSESEHFPVAPILPGGVIEVVVPPTTGDDLYDVNSIRCTTSGKVLAPVVAGADANALPPEAPVNQICHSAFSHVELLLNGKPVSCGNWLYPYKAYMQTHFGYGSDAKSSHLTARAYYADTPGKFQARTAVNMGYKQRAELFKGGRVVDMITPLHLDFLNQNRYLLSGVEMRFRFHMSKPEFHMMAPADSEATFQITSLSITVRRAQISPTVLLAISRTLETATAKYPIVRSECKTLTMNAGLRSKTFDSVITGPIPDRLMVGMVKNTAVNGSLQENPFDFEHNDANHVSLYVNGVQVPSKGLSPDFTHARSPHYIECYNTLFSGTGIHHKDEGNCLSRDDYPLGNTVFCFDLSPDHSAGTGHWNVQKTGCLRIDIRFKRDLLHAVNLIIYGEWSSLVEIDKYRAVHTDFST